MDLDIAHEFLSQILDGGEHTAFDRVALDAGKPDLDLVQLGGIGVCEMQLDVRMGFQRTPRVSWFCVPKGYR
jgi:hypothetical protein